MAQNPNISPLDSGQILRRVYDATNDQLRTSIDATVNIAGQQTLVIDQVADSIVIYGTTDGTFTGTHKAIKVDADGVVQVSSTLPGTITVNQGTSPWIVSGTISATNPSVSTTGSAIPVQSTLVGGTDGTNLRALKVSSAGVLSVDASATTQPISGTVAATQSGVWSTGRTWTTTSGTDSIASVQSGTWNVTNVSGTVSLPTGASTSTLQSTGNTSLASVVSNQTNGTQQTQVTNFPSTQQVSGSGSFTVAQATGTNLHAVIDSGTVASTQSGTWNINNIAGAVSLPTGASTAVLQTSGNSSLTSILANQTNGTQQTQVTNFPTTQAVSGSGNFTIVQPTGTNLHTTVDNFPATQPISGTVAVTQSTSPWVVSGTVTANAGSGNFTVVQGTGTNLHTVVDSGTIAATQSGAWSTGRTWTTSSGTDSIASTQSGTWTVQPGNTVNTSPWLTTISQGGNSAAVSSANALKVDGSASTQPVSGTVAVTQSTSPWVVSGTVTSNQGGAPWSINQTQINGTAVLTGNGITGTGSQRVTIASDNTAFTVNAAQSGSWTSGRTWTLASGTDSVASVQSGTWNVTNVSGTVSLPTGASTSALQSTGNTSLSSIDGKLSSLGQKASVASAPVVLASDQSAIPVTGTFFQATQPISAAALPLPSGASTSALQTTGNSSLSSIVSNQTNGTQQTQVTNFPTTQAVTQSGTWNVTNISGTVSLPTGAATSALQTSGNSSLTSISTNLTNGTQQTQVTNFPATQPVSGTVAVTQSTSPWVVSSQSLPGSFSAGQTLGATSGSQVALGSGALTNGVIIQALSTNITSIYVGPTGVTSSNGFELQAGQATSLGVSNLNLIFINSTTNNDGVCYIGN